MDGVFCRKTLIFFWILLPFLQLSTGKGVFELRLLSYANSNGRDVRGFCCGETVENSGQCLKSCSTFFRVCLKEYQSHIDLKSKCTYGSRITDLMPPGNSVDFSTRLGFEEPLEFSFSFGWPGYYSLIVEAYHNSTDHTSGTLNQLLMRVAEQKNIKPGSDWRQETHVLGSSTLKIEYRVLCSENHFGEQCSVSCRPRDDTFGHFTCSPEGVRICLPGWQGRLCDEAICTPGCDPVHGTCQKPYECVCEMGWMGEKCDECQRYPGCLHGSCRDKFECTCDDGWGGIFCNQDLNYCTHHRPCLNGATCTNTGQGHYTCTCHPGYTGTNCETKIQDCSMSPCLNGGICKELETNYSCECPTDFSGRHCQINARTCAESPCQNGASCVDSFDGYQCYCASGWTGGNCDIEADECQSDPCFNGGRCVDEFNGYQCVCPVGFEGQRCETNINDCSETTCQNGGRCEDDINNFKCVCPAGFSGTLCQYNIDDCIKRPCANGGTCFDQVNSYSCMCRPGFRGKDCSIDINECASSPCRNSGVCEDLVDDYRCQCGPCFSGKNCETRHDDCRFSNTFKPFPGLHTTPNYPNNHVYPGQREKQASQREFQETVIIVVIPVIVAFAIIVILLGGIVVCLYKKQKRNERGDLEARQNERNQRMAASECINNKFVSGMPQTAIISPFSKIDNAERSASMKGQNLDQQNSKNLPGKETDVNLHPYPMALADRNTFKPRPVCKAVSVDKLNYSQKYRANHGHESINRQQLKGFEGRGCISPTPRSPRDVASPPPFLKTDISKDSGLGSPQHESLSPRLVALASSESASDLEASASPSLSVSVVSDLGLSSPGEGLTEASMPSPLRHEGGLQTFGNSPNNNGGEFIVCATGVARPRQDYSGLSTSTGRTAPNFGRQLHRHGPRPVPPPRQNQTPDEYATQV